MASGGPPDCSLTRATIARSRWARSASAPYGRAAEDDRGRVAEAALELARGPGRLAERASLGGVAGEDLAVGAQDDDGRDRRRPLAQLEDLDPVVARRRGGRVGRSEIDPERVRHRFSPSSPGWRATSLACLPARYPEGTLGPMTNGPVPPRADATAAAAAPAPERPTAAVADDRRRAARAGPTPRSRRPRRAARAGRRARRPDRHRRVRRRRVQEGQERAHQRAPR